MSVASRLDPRAKLAAWFSLTVTYLLLPAGAWRWGWLGVVTAVAVASGGGRSLARFLTGVILPTAVMLVIVYGMLAPPVGDLAWWNCYGLKFRASGVVYGLDITARLAALGGATVALLATSPPLELSRGLRAFGAPPWAVTLLLSSLGLMRVIEDRIRRISAAQRSRGLCPRGFIVGRARVVIPILQPLFFSLLTDALERSALWSSRPYALASTVPAGRPVWADLVVLVISAAAMVMGGGLRCLSWID